MNDKVQFLLISDFTINPLQSLLKQQFHHYSCDFMVSPIGQIIQSVNEICCQKPSTMEQAVILWTMPDRQIHEFKKLYSNNMYDKNVMFRQVLEYAEYIRKLSEVVKFIAVPIWTLNSNYRGNGILNFRYSTGIYSVLMQMNLKLAKALEDLSNVYILYTDQWMKVSEKAEDEKMWYFGKIPFTQSIFRQAAEDIKSIYDVLTGRTKKLLVLDLDNTLWGGIAGEDGINGIRLGGVDYIGEAFLEFQKHLLQLKNKGLLLAICSKNDEDTAMEIIEKHTEMILRKEDFVGFKINWEDKAKNIRELALELNLGLASVVFIDDSPFERARVMSELPEVLVPEWPMEPIHYVKALNGLRCFDKASFSTEDTQRTNYYRQEQERKKTIENTSNIEEWLYQIALEVRFEPVNDSNVQRVSQLLNKTNQFNLITRRLEQYEIMAYCNQEQAGGVAFYAADKFGSYGLIGFSSYEMNENSLFIKDFLLSCRAMGKGIEMAMLNILKDIAVSEGKDRILAQYIPTDRNKASGDFLGTSGFMKDGAMYVQHNLRAINKPPYITITNEIEI
ncbi:hypothetical protein acsn021_19790 [Anaerocolumna cellulosilytica]|uniref:Uncharacterized protein n=1 Tax=Anaerocolumna cellulosilytica TaxID=433286 RepID=A0A6S6R4S0_9FIRM|nr:HAD-IIIC family phosphatase [Anaerocolumna cellulosilytica]MBB5196468.1 FkbH-like protein [Anaerocolumna cellulosilytica]BCJ94410.1 hypothetical protein acsn021_19790 [Anaerocolumna cellulosilytica]